MIAREEWAAEGVPGAPVAAEFQSAQAIPIAMTQAVKTGIVLYIRPSVVE
jgi:hypothetical protein